VGERLETRSEPNAVYAAAGLTETFAPSGGGAYVALGRSGLSLSRSGSDWVVVDGAGRKHHFSTSSPFLRSIDEPTGEQLCLTLDTDGRLASVQSPSSPWGAHSAPAAGYSFRWTSGGRLERVYDLRFLLASVRLAECSNAHSQCPKIQF
jgi:hypothetical protein